MCADRQDVDIAEVFRKVARTGIGTSSGIIIDRKRVDSLAKEILVARSAATPTEVKSEQSEEHTTEMNVAKSVVTKSNTVAPTIAPTVPSSDTEITGIQIGAGQKAEFKSLDSHFENICECQKCPLGATRTKFVYGVGSPTADLLFVGEAPGKNEDEQGEPFVGRAGKLLDKILAAIDLTRSEIYIANILKCRPPDNRDPQSDEMEHCFPYLKEQIAIIKPKIIVSLGRISAQSLLQNKLPLGKMRDQWHSYQGIPLRVTYHPAALLRNPNFKRGCWEDMQIIQAEYQRLSS